MTAGAGRDTFKLRNALRNHRKKRHRRGWETPSGEKRTTVEILAEKAYFGEKKTELEGDEDQFIDLGDDDGSLPF